MNRKIATTAVLVGSVAVWLGACGPRESGKKPDAVTAAKVVITEPETELGVKVTRAEFVATGKRCPLTVPDARVGCVASGALWVHANGTKYSLNSLATREAGYHDLRAIHSVDQKSMDELRQITRRKATVPWYIDLTDLMLRAQATCR